MDLTKITTPLGLLDEATQEALKAHFKRGGKIEHWVCAGSAVDEWRVADDPIWYKKVVYRAKPEPAKPREFWVIFDQKMGCAITAYDSKGRGDIHQKDRPNELLCIHCREVL